MPTQDFTMFGAVAAPFVASFNGDDSRRDLLAVQCHYER
jgi:hypothetical protein